MQITGVILSGGQSTRMGTDKALIQINGKTLLENAIEICKSICNDIIISSNYQDHEKFGYKVVPDEIENCGPMGGIFSSLKESNTHWNFVISVDAAYVEPDFVKFIISEIGSFDAIVPAHNEGKEPLISLYNKNGLPKMLYHLESGNFKMHNLLSTLSTKFVNSQNWVEKFPKIFFNLNRPSDI